MVSFTVPLNGAMETRFSSMTPVRTCSIVSFLAKLRGVIDLDGIAPCVRSLTSVAEILHALDSRIAIGMRPKT
jgi:hypothetical protein